MHNILPPLNLRAAMKMLNIFKTEKPTLFKDGDCSIERIRKPFVFWLFSLTNVEKEEMSNTQEKRWGKYFAIREGKMKKLKVVITGIPQEWLGPVRMWELEEKGISFALKGGYYEIVLENSELAIGLLKKECQFIL